VEGSGTLAMATPITFYAIKTEKIGSNEACNLKFKNIASDLHFAYPTVTTDAVKKN
jgi:DNA polymerase-3 subunit delta'